MRKYISIILCLFALVACSGTESVTIGDPQLPSESSENISVLTAEPTQLPDSTPSPTEAPSPASTLAPTVELPPTLTAELDENQVDTESVDQTEDSLAERLDLYDPNVVEGILATLAFKGVHHAEAALIADYEAHFNRLDRDNNATVTLEEYTTNSPFFSEEQAAGIFNASDRDQDGQVTQQEYIENRIITDEAKLIFANSDTNGDELLTLDEWVSNSGLAHGLATATHAAFDVDGNGEATVPEYLQIWGRWGRGETPDPDGEATFTTESEAGSNGTAEPKSRIEDEQTERDLTQLWSYGLISIRTGKPLIDENGEHQLDESLVSHGYNLVVDRDGQILSPRAVPLHGGEQLTVTDVYQEDHNAREYARIFTIMAPIRDAILYHFEELTKEEWLAMTEVLTINNIKTIDADVVDGRAILSTEQVYDYVASGNAEGSPVARYLEEAGLELKCLAFVDFDFTNPEGVNHCEAHDIEVGAGIEMP